MTLSREAESLLLHQFEHSPNLKALIRCLISPLDDVITQLDALDKGRYIDGAFGETLDIIGSIVGQARNGLSDEDYRAFIKVGVHLNNGLGTPENTLNMIRILYRKIPNVEMVEQYPEHVQFTIFELPHFPLKTLMNIIKQAAPIGTKCLFLGIHPSGNGSTKNNGLSISEANSLFRFDYSAFSNGYFSDFIEEKRQYE